MSGENSVRHKVKNGIANKTKEQKNFQNATYKTKFTYRKLVYRYMQLNVYRPYPKVMVNEEEIPS